MSQICNITSVSFLILQEWGENRDHLSFYFFFIPLSLFLPESFPHLHRHLHHLSITHQTARLDNAVQHCHQHRFIQRLRLRWLTWKQNGKKHVYNIRSLPLGIYETPLQRGMLVNSSGLRNFIASWVQRVDSIRIGLFEWLELSWIWLSITAKCNFLKASNSSELILKEIIHPWAYPVMLYSVPFSIFLTYL